jgi:hypothetical protein
VQGGRRTCGQQPAAAAGLHSMLKARRHRDAGDWVTAAAGQWHSAEEFHGTSIRPSHRLQLPDGEGAQRLVSVAPRLGLRVRARAGCPAAQTPLHGHPCSPGAAPPWACVRRTLRATACHAPLTLRRDGRPPPCTPYAAPRALPPLPPPPCSCWLAMKPPPANWFAPPSKPPPPNMAGRAE